MKCADPVLCYTDVDGKKSFRHFSLANLTFKKLHQTVFDCGKCLYCRKKRAYELAARCTLHASLYSDNCFITLTYDEKKDGYHNRFNYRDIQLFKKSLRKHCSIQHCDITTKKIVTVRKKIEIFNVHEYGKNGKKHWHLVIFNHDFADKTLYTKKGDITIYSSKRLEKLWPHGFNTVGDVTTASAMYQAQYMEKDFKNGNAASEKKSNSKHSGIAKPYFLKHYKQILTLGYVPVNGRKMPVPRSFEKTARSHYAYYFEPSLLLPSFGSKNPVCRKPKEPNFEIACLWRLYRLQKTERIRSLELAWSDFLASHFESGGDPDFVKSESNALYDLQNKNSLERF